MAQLVEGIAEKCPAVPIYNAIMSFPSDRWFTPEAVQRRMSIMGTYGVSRQDIAWELDTLVRNGMLNKEFGLYRNPQSAL